MITNDEDFHVLITKLVNSDILRQYAHVISDIKAIDH